MTRPNVEKIDHLAQSAGRLVSQFENSTKLIGFLNALVYSNNELEEAVYTGLEGRFLDNAQGVWLDIIGIIVGQSRTLLKSEPFPFFAFEGVPNAQTYGDTRNPLLGGEFYSLGSPDSGATVLNDNDYRAFIKARIVKNYSEGTGDEVLEAIDTILSLNGQTQLTYSEGDMEYTVHIDKVLTDRERYYLTDTGLVPKPTGVKAIYEDNGGTFYDGRKIPIQARPEV